MIKILHLSYCHKNTGAGIAAKRIHYCICDYKDSNIKSFLRINTNGFNNKNILYTKNLILRFCNLFKKYLERIIIKVLNYKKVHDDHC